MYCKNCGKEVSEDATFCNGCGIRIENEKIKPEVDEQALDQEYYSTLFVEKDETLFVKCSNEKFLDNLSDVNRIKPRRFSVLVTDKRLYLRGFMTISKEEKEKTLRRTKVRGLCGKRIDKTVVELKNIISTDLFGLTPLLDTIIMILCSLIILVGAVVCISLGVSGVKEVGLLSLCAFVYVVSFIISSYSFNKAYCLTLITNEEIIMLLIRRKDCAAVSELQKKIFYAKSQLKSSEMQQDTQ